MRVFASILLVAAWCALIGALHLAFGPGIAQAALFLSMLVLFFIGRGWIARGYSARTGRPAREVSFWDLEWEDRLRGAALGIALIALALLASYVGAPNN